MTDERYKYCDHMTFGVGSAQLVKYRKDARDDLFMCTFQSQGFDKVLYKEGRENPKKKRTKTVRKKEVNLQDLLDSLR